MTRQHIGALALAAIVAADFAIFAFAFPSPVLDRAATPGPAAAPARPPLGRTFAPTPQLDSADLIALSASSAPGATEEPSERPTATPRPPARTSQHSEGARPSSATLPGSPSAAPLARRASAAVFPWAVWSGRASWYDNGRGLYAAVPHWSGVRFTLVVRLGTKRVTVTVRDSCQCYVGTRDERVIDLSPAAFAALRPTGRSIAAQLDRGIVTVTITGRRRR